MNVSELIDRNFQQVDFNELEKDIAHMGKRELQTLIDQLLSYVMKNDNQEVKEFASKCAKMLLRRQ